MKTINNVSAITDYSGDAPIITYSNTVTTVIRQNVPTPVITRIFYRVCCDCDCDFDCDCDCDFDCCCDFCCGCCDF